MTPPHAPHAPAAPAQARGHIHAASDARPPELSITSPQPLMRVPARPGTARPDPSPHMCSFSGPCIDNCRPGSERLARAGKLLEFRISNTLAVRPGPARPGPARPGPAWWGAVRLSRPITAPRVTSPSRPLVPLTPCHVPGHVPPAHTSLLSYVSSLSSVTSLSCVTFRSLVTSPRVTSRFCHVPRVTSRFCHVPRVTSPRRRRLSSSLRPTASCHPTTVLYTHKHTHTHTHTRACPLQRCCTCARADAHTRTSCSPTTMLHTHTHTNVHAFSFFSLSLSLLPLSLFLSLSVLSLRDRAAVLLPANIHSLPC